MSSPAAPSVRHWQIVGGSAAVQPITGGAHEAWTLIGSEDTTIELVLDDDYAIIFKVGNSGEMSASGDYQLQYEVNGAGGFANVDATSSNLRSAVSGDADAATSTTERLSTSAQTFQTSVLDDVDGLTGTNITGGNEHEFYFTFNLRGAELTAGAESIELRLTTGGATFDHTAVEPILITLPAFAEPPASYLPVPKANRTIFKRLLITPPHPAEYPQPPAPAVSVAAETPALKANRIKFKRTLRALPQHDEWAEIPAITARITHLAAGILYNQAPPAARITHLTAAIIYGTPRSQEVPETNAKAMAPFHSAFTRAIQPIAHNPDYPVTPPPPASVVAETPALKANYVEYRRILLALPELDQFPPTPLIPEPFTAYTPVLKVIITEFERELQKLLQLDQFTETPPGFFAGQWPASLTLRPIEISADRALQTLPELDQFTPTPPGFFEGHYPAPFRVDSISIVYDRSLQTIPPLWEYPPTPFGFQWGFYPGSKAVESLRVSFDRTLQTLELDERPPTPPSTAPVVAFQLPPVFTWQFKRTVQGVELNERPPTPPGFFEGFFPAPIRLKRIPSAYHREAQVPLELDERPPTPAGFFDGFYPGSARVSAFRAEFERQQITVLEIDEYPLTPVSAEDYPALTPVLKANKTEFRRQIQFLEINEYPPTPFGFQWGFYPGSARVEANHATFTRTLQTLPIPAEYPAAALPVVPYTAFTPVLAANRSEFERQHRDLPHNPIYPVTPPGFRWPRPSMPTFRVEFDRELAKLPQHDQWTPTPPGFFDGQYPAPFRVDPFTVSFDRSLQTVSSTSIPPVVPYTAYLAVTTFRRRATVFKAFTPPLLQLSRIFPPSIIIGDARWKVPVIYRRDIHRTIQPVWKPAAIIGEAFRDIDPECKWFADCAPVLWNAEKSLTLWKADAEQTWDADCD